MHKTKKYLSKQNIKTINFPTDIASIWNRLNQINPEKYAISRNYVDGAVTYLSPYLSRGVISTKTVYDHIMTLDLPWLSIEKLIQELAWRDYWQQVWIAKGDSINTDLKHKQSPVANYGIPEVVINSNTGIEAIDDAIAEMYQTGYMHNHMRMYVASICCNIANSHWMNPAKWMYSHLLDGDLASNHLSWQWVAGSFSNKKYYANQDNINKFFYSSQKNTILDIAYDQFNDLQIPESWSKNVSFDLEILLPEIPHPDLNNTKTSLIYNYYNLDPYWQQGEDLQRILLLEPSFFQTNPVTKKCIDFILDLSTNIPDIKIFVGEYYQLQKQVNSARLVFKEHPTNRHYRGKEEQRSWLTSIKGYFPSFFSFWKQCKKELMPH